MLPPLRGFANSASLICGLTPAAMCCRRFAAENANFTYEIGYVTFR
jgi:hypothetical protein